MYTYTLYFKFQILNTVKPKRIKIARTIEILTDYENDGTLPDCLNNVIDCDIILDDALHSKSVKESLDTTKLRFNTLLEENQCSLTNIELNGSQTLVLT